MHKYCSNCGLKYQKEVGFFYGAMYVSYALGVAVFVFLWGGTYFFFPEMDMLTQAIAVSIGIVVFSPLIFHWSRLIWINFFYRYSGNKIIDHDNLKKAEEDNIDQLT